MKEKLSLVGVLIIIAGAAFATARLAWSPKTSQTEQRLSEQIQREPESVVERQESSSQSVVQEESEGSEGFEGVEEEQGSVAGEKVTTPTSTPEQTQQTPEEIFPIPSGAPTPIVENEQTPTASLDIKVEMPTSGQVLSSPFTVQGESRLQAVRIHVTNKVGTVLINERVPVRFLSGQKWGAFSWKISYEFSGTKEGYIIVLPEDSVDGGVKVPVTF